MIYQLLPISGNRIVHGIKLMHGRKLEAVHANVRTMEEIRPSLDGKKANAQIDYELGSIDRDPRGHVEGVHDHPTFIFHVPLFLLYLRSSF